MLLFLGTLFSNVEESNSIKPKTIAIFDKASYLLVHLEMVPSEWIEYVYISTTEHVIFFGIFKVLLLVLCLKHNLCN